MRASKSLTALQRCALARSDCLRLVAALPKSGSALDRQTAFVVVEAHSLWSSYCRSFYLSCAFAARDRTGTHVLGRHAAYATEQDALTRAIYAVKPQYQQAGRTGPWTPYDEPAWADPLVFGRALSDLAPTNLGTVRSALAARPAALNQLATFRNFYAHRGIVAARKVQRLATSYRLHTSLHPTGLLNSFGYGRPQVVLADLIDDIRTTIQLMN